MSNATETAGIALQQKSPAVNHLGYLDGLRALAALFVVVHHAFLQVNPAYQPNADFSAFAVSVLFHGGHYAVALFIVLSGFCLMLPVIKSEGSLRGGTLNFFVRRAWRILPPYYLAMAFSLLLIWLLIGQKTGTHWDISIPVTTKSILTHLSLTQDVFADTGINHVFWSISVEWRIYFLFPLLLIAWRRFGPLITTAITLASSFILLKIFFQLMENTLRANFIGLFALGMLGAAVAFTPGDSLRRLRQLPWEWITLALAALVAVLTLVPMPNGAIATEYLRDYVVGAWSMSLLITLSCKESHCGTRFLSARPLAFIGTFAYSLYLIHAPLLQVLWQYAFVPLQTKPLAMFAALLLIGTPIIVGVSYVFFLVCEKPFIGKGKKRAIPPLTKPLP